MPQPHSPEFLTVADAHAWRQWLDQNEESNDGVWLTIAKKGTTVPTSLTYAEALDEALCSGWIDGRKNRIDTATYRQLFTPRRARSTWSKRNINLVARLIREGRMRDRGHREIERAKADGRWERAYAGSATIDVPTDLRDALNAAPDAAKKFSSLNSTSRYPILMQIVTSPNAAVRAARIARHIERLVADARSQN